MEDHTPARLAPEPRNRQRVRDDVGRHARLDRPADDLTVEQVQHDGQVQPAFSRVD